MPRKIFSEYLGDVSAELLLQNLTNLNPHRSSIDIIRAAVPAGFTVTAEIEQEVLTSEECEGTARNSDSHPPGKLVRLVLEPKQNEPALL